MNYETEYYRLRSAVVDLLATVEYVWEDGDQRDFNIVWEQAWSRLEVLVGYND